MKLYHFHTVSQAYLGLLSSVLGTSEHQPSPRGKQILEITDVMFEVAYPSSEAITTRSEQRNTVIKDYLAKEFALYESGSNRADDFAKISKFWEKIANPDGTINSAYGYLIFRQASCGESTIEKHTPWDWARRSLLADRDTRQAFLRFSLPQHQFFGNKDQVCTMHGNFLIRDNRLNFTVVMRSCDMVKGLVYDMPWFCYLLERMHGELLWKYSDLQVGVYRHMVHSLHVYMKDLDTVRAMLG